MHQNTEFFTTLAQLTQNKANWKNRNHPPWGVGPVSGTCEVILGALRPVWTCPVQDRYWNTGINPAEALAGWSWDWGTKCTRRGCTQGLRTLKKKPQGDFTVDFNYLVGECEKTDPNSSQGCSEKGWDTTGMWKFYLDIEKNTFFFQKLGQLLGQVPWEVMESPFLRYPKLSWTQPWETCPD